jgi:Heterokaryon incompatibility protein (HET)
VNRTPITLSGHTVEITANLEIALRHLRHRDTYRTLWVDALCIDQMNLLERSLLVLRVRDIFGSADMVLAWTGGDADGD